MSFPVIMEVLRCKFCSVKDISHARTQRRKEEFVALEPDVLQLSSGEQSCINIGRSVWTTMANDTTDVAKQATKTTAPDKLLDRLLNFEPTAAPVISLYLDARADQHGQQNFLPFVRKQLTERSKSYENQSEERLS